MNSREIVVRAEGLGKRYRLGGREARARYPTLRDALVAWPGRMAAAMLRKREKFHAEHFWALRDATFSLARGEALGIIGRNGAGKSTLLKILSRITEPTVGRAEMHGRVGTLLEVGTGFHPELTGRENIFLSGAILGMRRLEIERRFDEIVAFAELERFLDTPVKRYSSGMVVRLGFSVAAHLDPEVLIADEVLAVGDLRFQERCLGAMKDLARSERTVLFVTHNMAAVASLCSRGILLEGGEIVYDGEISACIDRYVRGLEGGSEEQRPLRDLPRVWGSGELRFTAIEFLQGETGARASAVQTGEDLEVRVSYEAPGGGDLTDVQVAIEISDETGRPLSLLDSALKNRNFRRLPPRGRLRCRVPRFPLGPGRYLVGLGCSGPAGVIDYLAHAAVLSVETGDFYRSGRLPAEGRRAFFMDHDWSQLD